MERMMSVEDKIKRAEEIYYKRKERDIPVRETIKKINKWKEKYKTFQENDKTDYYLFNDICSILFSYK